MSRLLVIIIISFGTVLPFGLWLAHEGRERARERAMREARRWR
jgi:hypothetical protein